ncbi:MAG: type IV secretion protein DotI [Coxiella sp. DG_40]|nr:MAG: type IV secretion protein DotI [Coxiella sp. DG_40]
MAEEAAEIIRLRNEFYRDNYRRVMLALLIMIVVNVALVGVVYYQLTHRPTPQYFAITSDGKIMKLQPLNQPVIAPSVLLQWANRAAVAAYSYNFVNYRDALQDLQNKFTPDGWKNFEKALQASKMLETIIAKKLVVSAVATGAPVILDQGVVGGYYVWKVNMPLLVTYESPSELTQHPMVVTMIVSRVSPINYPDGIAIASFVAAESRLSTE